jgi:hypothetical protein
VFGVVFVRKLREGKTYADFRDAWYPEAGFGTPSRILSGPGVVDPTEIVTIGFVDAAPDDLTNLGEQIAAAEATRHDRIAEVIESTEIRIVFEIAGDDDFTGAPRPVPSEVRGFPWTATGPAD